MAIDRTKAASVGLVRLLYRNLRDLISGKYTKPENGIPASDLASNVLPDMSLYVEKKDVATIEDTLQIIEDYEEEDEDMLVTANFTTTNYPHFVTEEDASDIKAAIKSGKHVTVLFKHSSDAEQYGIMTDTYLSIAGIDEGDGVEGSHQNDVYLLAGQSGIAGSYMRNLAILNEQGIENGKLTFGIYID